MLRKVYRKIFSKISIIRKLREKLRFNKEMTKEKFYKKIKNKKVISFDIFDTLVCRTLYEPDDLFDLMAIDLGIKDFKKLRKLAEEQARKKMKKDVNIDEIYKAFSEIDGFSDKETEKFKEMEISLEYKFCVPRLEMLEIYNKLIENKKEVIIISDMYLTKKVIENILENCGYKNYSKLYVSCEMNKRKDAKTMWLYIKNIYKNKNFIHIGDNEKSDFINPKIFKLNAIKINSSKELFVKSGLINYYPDLENRTVGTSILLGNIINKKMFNSPFSVAKVDNVKEFSYMYFGPLFNEFYKEIVNIKDNNLLFLAREGYSMQKLYKDFCKINKIKEIDNFYFLASRKATSMAIINSKKEIDEICKDNYSGTIEEFFKTKFGIKVKNNSHINLPEDISKIDIKKYEKDIITNSENEKKNYIEYIKKTVGDYENSKMTVIDLGYSGTIQYNFSKMLDKKISGYYLTNSDSIKKYYKDSKLNFTFDISNGDYYQKIYHYSLILEFFLQAPHGQLLGFSGGKNNKPIFNDEILSEEKQDTINELYSGVIEFFNDMSYFNKFDIDNSVPVRNYICAVESNLIGYNVKDKFKFIDAYNNLEEYNVFKKISKY